MSGRGIRDMERGEDISLPRHDVSEPAFGHASGGRREMEKQEDEGQNGPLEIQQKGGPDASPLARRPRHKFHHHKLVAAR